MIKPLSEILYEHLEDKPKFENERMFPIHSVIAIADAYVEQFKPKWIPTTERYPDKPGDCLIYGRFTRDCRKKVYQAFFDKKRRKFYSDGILSKNVTHWQPLPTPPETVEQKGE